MLKGGRRRIRRLIRVEIERRGSRGRREKGRPIDLQLSIYASCIRSISSLIAREERKTYECRSPFLRESRSWPQNDAGQGMVPSLDLPLGHLMTGTSSIVSFRILPGPSRGRRSRSCPNFASRSLSSRLSWYQSERIDPESVMLPPIRHGKRYGYLLNNSDSPNIQGRLTTYPTNQPSLSAKYEMVRTGV